MTGIAMSASAGPGARGPSVTPARGLVERSVRSGAPAAPARAEVRLVAFAAAAADPCRLARRLDVGREPVSDQQARARELVVVEDADAVLGGRSHRHLAADRAQMLAFDDRRDLLD